MKDWMMNCPYLEMHSASGRFLLWLRGHVCTCPDRIHEKTR